jgi:hypothetical protein
MLSKICFKVEYSVSFVAVVFLFLFLSHSLFSVPPQFGASLDRSANTETVNFKLLCAENTIYYSSDKKIEEITEMVCV